MTTNRTNHSDNQREERLSQRFGLVMLGLLFLFLIAGKPILAGIGIFTDAIGNFLSTF